MKTLDECRQELNDIDEKMKELYLKRMDVVYDVVKYKVANNIATYDPNREEAMIKRLSQDIDEKYRTYYLEFLNTILKTSKEYQDEVR